MDNEGLYAAMAMIRRFEETVLEEFSRGTLSGTTHCCIGQEANAVGVCSALAEGDVIFSNHRGHGHFLARYGDARGLAAELMGKRSGVCSGHGGSQHLRKPGMLTNGIQGGIVPNACGAALAEKMQGRDTVVVVFIGDGTLGQGVVYESLNMASLWGVPLLVVVENNHYAQTTPTSSNMAGSMEGRFEAFGIQTTRLDTTDVLEISQAAGAAVHAVRAGNGPRALIIDTYRFCSHSKGDDFRPQEEIEARKGNDPLLVHGARLSSATRQTLDREAGERVQAAFEGARQPGQTRQEEGA